MEAYDSRNWHAVILLFEHLRIIIGNSVVPHRTYLLLLLLIVLVIIDYSIFNEEMKENKKKNFWITVLLL